MGAGLAVRVKLAAIPSLTASRPLRHPSSRLSSVRSVCQFFVGPSSHRGPGRVSRTSVQVRVSLPSRVLNAHTATDRTFWLAALVDTPRSQVQPAQVDGVAHDPSMVMAIWGLSSSFTVTATLAFTPL